MSCDNSFDQMLIDAIASLLAQRLSTWLALCKMGQPLPDPLFLGRIPTLACIVFHAAERHAALARGISTALFKAPHARCRLGERRSDRQHAVTAKKQAMCQAKCSCGMRAQFLIVHQV